jgi:hypothetical protein
MYDFFLVESPQALSLGEALTQRQARWLCEDGASSGRNEH